MGIVVLLIVGFTCVKEYVIEKRDTEQAVAVFMERQKMPKSDIARYTIEKDYHQGGYVVFIETKKDPGIRYEYVYSDFTKDTEWKLSVIAYDKTNSSTEDTYYPVFE